MLLRFFFDAGSGVCLWAQDDAARRRFGYAVEPDALDLPPQLHVEMLQVIAAYDATIDWNDPARASTPDPEATSFGHEANAPLRNRVADFLPRLRAALGPAITVESDYEG